MVYLADCSASHLACRNPLTLNSSLVVAAFLLFKTMRIPALGAGCTPWGYDSWVWFRALIKICQDLPTHPRDLLFQACTAHPVMWPVWSGAERKEGTRITHLQGGSILQEYKYSGFTTLLSHSQTNWAKSQQGLWALIWSTTDFSPTQNQNTVRVNWQWFFLFLPFFFLNHCKIHSQKVVHDRAREIAQR